MIVPMSHVTVLCLASDKPEVLAKLAAMDVLHVGATVTDTEAILEARRAEAAAKRAVTIVQTARDGHPMALTFKSGTPMDPGDPSPVAEINRLADRYTEAAEHVAALTQTIDRYAPWGDFDPATVAALHDSGVPVTLFEARLSDDVPALDTGVLEVSAADKNSVYGFVAGAELPEGLTPVPMPGTRLADYEAERTALRQTMREIAAALSGHASMLEALVAERRRREEDGDYVTVFENMPTSGPITHLSGFIDSRKTDSLIRAAAAHGWGVALRPPHPEELPPTLLEPPRLFRPIVSLFHALGITPGYREADVSVPFFIFFSIFFSMLIGDAGYGALILLFTAIGYFRIRSRTAGALSATVRSLLTLFTVFGVSTIVYGVLSGTYFGIEKTALPELLRFRSVDFLENQDNIMRLCFTLGALHLSLARLWNAALLFPSRKFLAEIGWTGVIWSMYLIICGIVISGFTYPAWGTPMMIVSILLIVLFMLDVSELKEHGVNLGMLPLNIVSSMGDIISYVRLFAVGLASVKVAENFNMMALDLDLPMWIKLPAMALILVLGHGLNLVMGALSILVHAVRLNTLEFSGAKGVTWGGHPFKSFKATARRVLPTVDAESQPLSLTPHNHVALGD